MYCLLPHLNAMPVTDFSLFCLQQSLKTHHSAWHVAGAQQLLDKLSQ